MILFTERKISEFSHCVSSTLRFPSTTIVQHLLENGTVFLRNSFFFPDQKKKNHLIRNKAYFYEFLAFIEKNEDFYCLTKMNKMTKKTWRNEDCSESEK